MNKEVLKIIANAASENNMNLNFSKVKGNELLSELNLDSLNSIALVVSIENKHGIHIPDEELTKIKTIGDFVNVLERHLKK